MTTLEIFLLSTTILFFTTTMQLRLIARVDKKMIEELTDTSEQLLKVLEGGQ